MKYFALIFEGIVRNVAVADSLPEPESVGEWVAIPNPDQRPGPGWLYQNGKFINHLEPELKEKKIIWWDTLGKWFTDNELSALDNAAKTDAGVSDWINYMKVEQIMDHDPQFMIDKFNFLIGKNLFTEQRKEEFFIHPLKFPER